jgi:hypothetical protein
MNSTWRFPDPRDTEVITLERILSGESFVLLVTHDADDGTWQFLDGDHVLEEDGVMVRLGEIIQIDPSLNDLAELPAGWYAWRLTPSDDWRRAKGEPSVSLGHQEPIQTQTPDAARATNIEVKARVADVARTRATIESLSHLPVEILDQEDAFFAAPAGRLKIRCFNDYSGELIH